MNPAMATLVYRWLEAIGLAHAVPKFHAMHISTPLALMDISPEDHALLGVTGMHGVMYTRLRETCVRLTCAFLRAYTWA